MPWYDPPTDPSDPNTSYLGRNPAIRDAMMMLGANLLANARRPGMQGVGESVGAGFNTWAQRRDAYAKEADKAKLAAMLAAGHPSPIVPLPENARDPGFHSPYDYPLGTPVATQLASGPGTTLYQPGTAIPTPEAFAAGGVAIPGAAAPPAGGGIASQPPPIDPNDPRQPNSMLWNPQSVYEDPRHGGMRLPPTPPVSTIPYVAPAPPRPGAFTATSEPPPPDVPQYGSNASGLLNLAAAGGGAAQGPFGTGGVGRESLVGGAGQDVLASPVDEAAARAGLTAQDRVGWDRVINRESGGRHLDANGNVKVNKEFGATGLGQLLPSTFAEMKRKYNIQGGITDEAANAEASARYYKEQLDRYGGDIRKAGMAYFAGPDNVDKGIIGPKTAAYGDAIAGSQGQATIQGGAGQDVPQPPSNVARMGLEGVPEWKLQGLLEQAGGDGEGGMYDAQGNLTEATKRNLRISLLAGGPEGVQQALMQMANQKPEAFGTAETGYYLRYPSGTIKQLLAPQGKAKEHWDDITDQVPYEVGPHTRIMRNRDTGKEETLTTQPGPGMTVQVGEKGSEAFLKKTGELAAQEISDTSKDAEQTTAMAQDYAPIRERMKASVLKGEEGVESGWFRSRTSPFRKVLASFGWDPETATEDQMLEAKRGFWYQRMRDHGTGNPTEKEDLRLMEGMAGVGNTTLGNYFLTKGLDNNARYKTWLLGKKQEYAGKIDPKTGQPVGNLTLFNQWLNTPDENGHAPIDDRPRLYVDMTDPKDAQRAKKMERGDLYLDSNGKLNVLKLRQKDLTDKQIQELPDGTTILTDDGQLVTFGAQQ
jgi:hypothetical protein